MPTYMCTKCIDKAQKVNTCIHTLCAHKSGHGSGLGAPKQKSLQIFTRDVRGNHKCEKIYTGGMIKS